MEWISSTELIEMLKRFPSTQIETRRYQVSTDDALYTWMYCNDTKRFEEHLKGKVRSLTERKLLKEYTSDHWCPEPFFHLTNERQKSLAVRIIEYLIMTGNFDSVICECDINFVRQCDHCHKLMNEGWVYEGMYNYCSDHCLLAENPEMSQEELDNLVVDDDSETYWTKWDG